MAAAQPKAHFGGRIQSEHPLEPLGELEQHQGLPAARLLQGQLTMQHAVIVKIEDLFVHEGAPRRSIFK